MSWVNIGTNVLVWGILFLGTGFVYRSAFQTTELVVGVAIPIYQSHKALQMNNKVIEAQKASAGFFSKKEVPVLTSSQELSTWVTYGTVYGCWTITEIFADRIVGWWFPLYHPIKLASLIALQYPIPFVTDEPGAAIIYKKFIEPFLSNNEPVIDSVVENSKQKLITYSTQGLDISKNIVDSLSAQNIKDFTKHLGTKLPSLPSFPTAEAARPTSPNSEDEFEKVKEE